MENGQAEALKETTPAPISMFALPKVGDRNVVGLPTLPFGYVNVIQINVKPVIEEKEVFNEAVRKKEKVKFLKKEGRRYFCMTSKQQLAFEKNNPEADTESFTIQLPDYIAKDYLDNPENMKQFEEKQNA